MSDYLDYSINTREEFKQWILRKLGSPLITVEITNDALEDCLNDSVEYFSKYAMQDQDFIAIDLSAHYVEGVGVTLSGNITGVFAIDDISVGLQGDINRLFSIPNTMLNAGMLAIPANSPGYGWVNWELYHENLNLMKRMMGGGFQFEYNPRNKLLKLIPDPIKDDLRGWIIFGVNIIRPETMQYGEEWVKKYGLALAKVFVGRVRTKYAGTQMLGGGTVDTTILQEGITERDTLMEDLRTNEQGPFNFFVG